MSFPNVKIWNYLPKSLSHSSLRISRAMSLKVKWPSGWGERTRNCTRSFKALGNPAQLPTFRNKGQEVWEGLPFAGPWSEEVARLQLAPDSSVQKGVIITYCQTHFSQDRQACSHPQPGSVSAYREASVHPLVASEACTSHFLPPRLSSPLLPFLPPSSPFSSLPPPARSPSFLSPLPFFCLCKLSVYLH